MKLRLLQEIVRRQHTPGPLQRSARIARCKGQLGLAPVLFSVRHDVLVELVGVKGFL